MTEHIILGLAAIIILGVLAQWIAWRIRFPSILLLLVFGFLAGPVTGLLDPDELLGDLLFPIVSIAVAIILFEGGLSLKLKEIKATGSVVNRLLTVGVLITWAASSAASYYLLGLSLPISVLLGAIVVVSGPTVIIPMLMHIKPVDRVASVLRWEGILIDPIGAVLAVLVYETIIAGRFEQVPSAAALGILKTLLIGGAVGAGAAVLIVVLLRKYWLPDFLQSPATLMVVMGIFSLSNHLQPESGLLAVTVMGVVLANQSYVAVKHILYFKENLRVLLISGLFIILAARLRIEDLGQLNPASIAFLGILILLVRPVSVVASTLGSELNWRERAFISFMMPRGIVAAAVASVFALRLSDAGHAGAEALLPLTFLVIIGTVLVYGLGGPLVARGLGVAVPNPQGVLVLGAHPWAIELGKALKDLGVKVLLADINPANIFSARMAGLPVYNGSALSEAAILDIEMSGLGKLLALTSNNGVNSLAVMNFSEVFDSAELYQLPPREEEGKGKKGEKAGEKELVSRHLRGRYLFSPEASFQNISRMFAAGAVIRKTRLTEEFGFDAFKEHYGGSALPLFLVDESGVLTIFTTESPPEPKPGMTVVSFVGKEAAPVKERQAPAGKQGRNVG